MGISLFGCTGMAMSHGRGPHGRTRLRIGMKAEARAVMISEHMDNGRFDYLKWFPEGNRADQFKPKISQPVESAPVTINEYYAVWIEKKKPPFVRKSLERDYRQALDRKSVV